MKKSNVLKFLFSFVFAFVLAFSGMALVACGKEYTIKFDANGGDGTMAQIVVKGERLSLPENTFTPTQANAELGYRFAGWATKKDETQVVYKDASRIRVNKNMTLYAVWSNIYYITIDANGGKRLTKEPLKLSVVYGENVTLPKKVEVENYYAGKGYYYLDHGFVEQADKEWTIGEDLQYEDLVENVRQDKTFYVYYDSTYTINYVDEEINAGNPYPISIAYGSQQVVLKDANVSATIYSATQANLSLSDGKHLAYWTDIENDERYDVGDVISKDRLMFLYENSRKESFNRVILEVHAVWQTNEYNIAYNSNNSLNEECISQENVVYGTEMFLPHQEDLETLGISNPTGFVFKGWAFDRFAHTESSYMPGAQYVVGVGFETDQTITFYAIWEDESQTEFKITFDANGGTGEIAQQSVYVGKTTTIPNGTFEKDGFQFGGWALSADGDVVLYGNEEIYVPYTETDITLYAIWTEIGA